MGFLWKLPDRWRAVGRLRRRGHPRMPWWICGWTTAPADATDVINALLATGDDLPPPPENPMSADRVRWEHIQRVYELCDRNVSETARRLNMHRRTLQRILAKRSPR